MFQNLVEFSWKIHLASELYSLTLKALNILFEIQEKLISATEKYFLSYGAVKQCNSNLKNKPITCEELKELDCEI